MTRLVKARPKNRGACHVALVRGPLLSTPRSLNNEAVPVLGLALIAGYIEQHGYGFTLVDAIGEGLNKVWPIPTYPGYVCQGLTFDEIVARIPRESKVIAFSAMFSGEWPLQRDLIAHVREAFPDALIVAGGEHVSALTEYVLKDCSALDLGVRGEGEHVFYEILEAYTSGADYRLINGVSYLNEAGEYVSNDAMPRIRELQTVPWPHWPDGYIERFWASGKSYGIQSDRDMPIMVSRGCPYQCTFCSNPQMWTTRYVLRDIDDVVAEIKHYLAQRDITSLQFYDLTAITKKRWTLEFCEKLKNEGIKLNWSLPSGTRSEVLDFETLSLLKESGCGYMVYAPESGSPRTLERIKKRISLTNLTESMMMARKVGIMVRGNLILGFPGETRADVFRTMAYGLWLAFRGVDEVSINLFSPYPGSELFSDLFEQGRVELSDDYFLSLTSLNGDLFSINPMTVNENMGASELAIYRVGSMLGGYLIGYLRHPSRIVRTFRNVFGDTNEAATVMEHRLKDARRRRKGDAPAPSRESADVLSSR